MREVLRNLRPTACITGAYKRLHCAPEARPPIISTNELESLGHSKMASQRRIMTRLQDLESGSTIWDIQEAITEHKPISNLKLLVSLRAIGTTTLESYDHFLGQWVSGQNLPN